MELDHKRKSLGHVWYVWKHHLCIQGAKTFNIVYVEVVIMRVTLPYDPVWKPLEWAKEHCPSYITNAVHEENLVTKKLAVRIDYFFSNEKDALIFSLRWL